MSLLERRIGLLFALFLLPLCVVVGRASWLQGVPGRRAQRRRPEPADADRHGARLARVDPRPQRAASSRSPRTRRRHRHSVPGRRTRRRRPEARDGPRRHPDEILEQLADASRASPTSPARWTCRPRKRSASCTSPGIGDARRRAAASTRRASSPRRSSARSGSTTTASRGSRRPTRRSSHGSERRARVVLDGLGKEIERNTSGERRDGQDLRLTIDADIQARTEDVLAGSPRPTSPRARPRS